jgi:hypothetical protein
MSSSSNGEEPDNRGTSPGTPIGRPGITAAMLRAARQAEFDYYSRNRGLGSRFVPMPDAQMREVLEAAIAAIGEEDDTGRQEVADEPEGDALPPTIELPQKAAIVRARKPRPRR